MAVQFFRKLGVILATIPFTLIGVVLALKLTGTPFSFMATFGVLACSGSLSTTPCCCWNASTRA
jgi:multidrug efflux pump subunit AcrB